MYNVFHTLICTVLHARTFQYTNISVSCEAVRKYIIFLVRNSRRIARVRGKNREFKSTDRMNVIGKLFWTWQIWTYVGCPTLRLANSADLLGKTTQNRLKLERSNIVIIVHENHCHVQICTV